MKHRERRFFDRLVRAIGGAEARRIQGTAIVYDRESEVLGGWFVEVIRPGAVTDALRKSDVRCLFNHDPNLLLGRTASGTLTLKDTRAALEYDCEAPDTQLAADLLVLLDRGDVSQSSFAFTISEDRWTFSKDPDTPTFREVLKIDELFDVSPVTYPAYPQTEAYARAVETNRRVLDTAMRSHLGRGLDIDEAEIRRREAQLREMELQVFDDD
ncbi:MAG: HK97 family phage prohead protease [Phycisphaerales bacterium]|nr:HK97 family phage prohead protease [Phycisphaerales bacterium]